MLNQTTIDNLRQAIKDGVQTAVAPQLFETPRDLAQRMADIILQPTTSECGRRSWNGNKSRILEPSAGTGNLIEALGASWYPRGQLVAIEINCKLSSRLKEEFPLTSVINDDFLKCFPDDPMCNRELGHFDRIIMNPPFINGADIKHIQHAVTFLKPGGLLVAICAGGPRQERKLQPLASTWEPLPSGTFKQAGTNVNSVLLTIEG